MPATQWSHIRPYGLGSIKDLELTNNLRIAIRIRSLAYDGNSVHTSENSWRRFDIIPVAAIPPRRI